MRGNYMFGSKSNPVPEYKAEGELERVYHEIRQTLRVTGVNLNFRTWAHFGKFLPAMWDAFRPNAETRAFENAADEVRRRAVRLADQLPRLNAVGSLQLGESRSWQIQRALDLYHYINPKLLVLTSAVAASLRGEQPAGESGRPDKIAGGPPPGMYAMEMVDENPQEKQVRRLFNDIKKTLSLSSINSDYRTLALWPDYLQASWRQLKPVCQSGPFHQAAEELRKESRKHHLPYDLHLSRAIVEELGEAADQILETTQKFEQLLPALILNIALLQFDWKQAPDLEQSPYPAESAISKEAHHALA